MKGMTAFALFCEDIRREGAGRDTLIGIMPDTLQVSTFPGALRRLGVYFRIRLDVGGKYRKPIRVDLEIPGVDDVEIAHEAHDPIPQDVIERSLARAKERGLPHANIVGRMRLQEPVAIPSPRTFLAVLKYGNERYVCGTLTILERQKDSSTAPPLKAEAEPEPPAL